jgi:thiamine pyrophosphate-dependent acetolactate synthase large subunit-like protein
VATKNNGQQTAAQLLIRSLVQQNVKHIFGIPGGKIITNALVPATRDDCRCP